MGKGVPQMEGSPKDRPQKKRPDRLFENYRYGRFLIQRALRREAIIFFRLLWPAVF